MKNQARIPGNKREYKKYITLGQPAKMTGKAKSTVSRQANKEGWEFVYTTRKGGRQKSFCKEYLPDKIKTILN